MNENTKTLGFVGVAVVLLLGAWALQPRAAQSETESLTNTKFFPEFTDPAKAAAMEIVDFDPTTGPHVFKVAQVNGVWSIPSHQNYPADGKDHLAQAAASVIDLTRLDMKTDKPSEHELYGVLEPDSKLTLGSTGVGKRVTLEDKAGNKLAQFIIGNEVEGRPGLRYVRVPGQDQVYMVEVKPDKLSTKFQNWIEEDLLKLNAFDVKQIVIDDHSLDEVRGEIVLRGITTIDFNSKDSKWSLVDDRTFNPQTGKWTSLTLAEDEELNVTKLNELKNALDDLKIVDVVHKPAGLSADLRAGEDFSKDIETKMSLLRRGFLLARTPENTFEVYSNEGEVRCGTTEGVEYVLRFGGIAGASQDDEKDEKEKDAEKKPDAEGADAKSDDKKEEKKDAATEAGVNRYIMVTARFRPELIAPPELQPLPEVPGGVDEPADAKAGDEKPAGDKPAATGSPEKSAAPEKPAADAPAVDKPDAPKEQESSRFDARQGPQVTLAAYQPGDAAKQPAAKQPAAKQPAAKAPAAKAPATKAAPAADAKATEQKPADDKAASEKATDEKPAGEKPADEKAPATEAKPDAPQSADEAAAAADKARREALAAYKRISEDNKRKQDEYDKKVEAGKKRVEELNARFADWYYVISDKTYEKIHISREQLLQKKGAKDEAGHDDHDGHDHGLPPGLQLPQGLTPGGPKQ